MTYVTWRGVYLLPAWTWGGAYWRNGYHGNRLGVTTPLNCKFMSAHFFPGDRPVLSGGRGKKQPLCTAQWGPASSWRTINQMCFPQLSRCVCSYCCSGAGDDLKHHRCDGAVVANVTQQQPTWLRMTRSGSWRASLGTWGVLSGLFLSQTLWKTNAQVGRKHAIRHVQQISGLTGTVDC